jgi:integrase
MWRVIHVAQQGEQGERDVAIVWMLFGCGLRREELVSVRLGDVNLDDRLIHVRATGSKSVHARDITLPVEVVKELDHYIADVRNGDSADEAPLFTDRHGRPLTGNAVRLMFDRLKIRTGIRDLSTHICRHTWATNCNRSASGSKFDLQVQGGWTTGRMVDRYCKVRPIDERRRAPSVFSASRRALSERRLSGRRSSGKKNARPSREVA